MRVYLDSCSFNRPFDDQTFLSVYLETTAKLSIQSLITSNVLELVWSDVLDYENGMNPNIDAQKAIFLWRRIAKLIARQNLSIKQRAERLLQLGLKTMDALHISCAIESECEYFITVDKGILKKREQIDGIVLIDPIQFIANWEENNENGY
ncbi:MAG: hypothetical protein ACRCUY_00545 [Thermoguttaceae bacterium]